MANAFQPFNAARTKIVATVGPACEDRLREMVQAGVDVFRINSAHGSQADFARIVDKIESVRRELNVPVGTLLDLAGPKIRLGTLVQDPMELEDGQSVSFIRGTESKEATQFTCNYAQLIDDLVVGDLVMLTDGTISLRVTAKKADEIQCVVINGGAVRSRQGINLPGASLSVSAMRSEDVENALWATKQKIDFISLSFVRTEQDVHSLKNLLSSMGSNALVIAKIEKREALDHLEAIVEASDGIMVARGDLGVEIDVAETPVAQKKIIKVCEAKMKPVIVATQMLESMHHSRRPTRAEASDVANAILDGADACMLSGETAIGDFPVITVEMMNRIMLCTENILRDAPIDGRAKNTNRVHPITSAVTHHAANIAESIQAKLVVVATRSGATAWIKGKQRNYIPTLGISNADTTLQRMSLFWGITPHKVEDFTDPQKLFDEVSEWGCSHGILATGDYVVFVGGTGVMNNTHNLVVVHQVASKSN